MLGARTFAFGEFLLVPERQLLTYRDMTVRIGCRALDLLTALVERPGELVTKAELIARAWPTTTVEEGNLKVNMTALRKALFDDAGAARFIATVTGRGYRFIAPVEVRRFLDGPDPLAHDNTGPSLASSYHPGAPAAMSAGSLRSGPHPGGGPSDPAWPSTDRELDARARVRLVELPAEDRRGDASHCDGLLDAIDYGIVVDGEITLLVGDTSVLLKPGSLFVRRGSGQSWANLSGKPAHMLFVEINGRSAAMAGLALA